MSFEHCRFCLPPVRYPAARTIARTTRRISQRSGRRRPKRSGRRRQKTIIWERASSKRGAIND